MNTQNTDRIAELERQLAEARAEDEADRRARAEGVEPIYKFTVEIPSFRDKAFHPDYAFYDLRGVVVNEDELRAVGKVPFQGSGGFMFDQRAGRFICTTAGSFFTPTPGFRSQDLDYNEIYGELAAFITENPLGGDVTEIVNRIRDQYNGK